MKYSVDQESNLTIQKYIISSIESIQASVYEEDKCVTILNDRGIRY